ncbi:gliding motility-associated C-terminal domain-containing protein [Saprospira grandis]|uniref:T9SS type B sorting domain-containing protein n=1 Tax=Saprospira grandis TaxID=1008 RepID=UPI0022DDC499|nr:gliding motility-associated C-terminal domain-containing protein [Saprospira grandis]WBM74089.1 gliding motility-associated C-terminal domain-containing protein [Saprospira grandis]
MRHIYLFGLLFLCSWSLQAQVRLEVIINSGTAGTSCTDGIFGGSPDPQWRVNVESQGWTTYPQSGACFTDAPNTQYDEEFICATDYPANIQLCFRAFEDDGAACVVDQTCLAQICQNFATPAPGSSLNYTLSIPNCCGNSSWGQVDFTIRATGSFVNAGQAYDQICNAINLGTLNSNSSIGDNGLSNYGNFCATNTLEPSPWGNANEQGVWFQFTTGPNPSASLRFEAISDPQNLGDGIDLQLALYESSNGSCNGALSLVAEDYQGAGALYDEEMSVECLQPNTTYFLLVDGEDSGIPFTDGGQGYFGLEIFDLGVQQSADSICAATHLGPVPTGGQVQTNALSQSNLCAGNANEPVPGNWSNEQGVWFSFEAPASGHVIIEANSDQPAPFGTDAVDLQLALYSSSTNNCTGSLSEIDSDYDPTGFGEELDVRCLEAGRIYYIMVDGSTLNVDGIFDLEVRDGGIPPAPNDEICNTIALGAPAPGGTVGLTDQNNYCADNLFEPIPNNWGNDRGVWYTFVAPPSGKVEIRAENQSFFGSDQIDLQLVVYDAANQSCNDPLTEIQSEHDGIGVVWDENMEVECLTPGRTYFLMVDGEGALFDPDLQEGIFDLEVYGDPRDPPATNDDPCNAIYLGDPTGGQIGTSPGPQHGSQNNFCATGAGEPNPGAFNPNQTVWYTFTAPASGNVEIELSSDDPLNGVDPIDLQVAVWEAASCTGSWREMNSGDDLVVFDLDLEVYCLNPGQIYYVQVNGADLAILDPEEGYFDITITEIPPIPVAPNNLICNAIPLGDPFTNGPQSITNQHNLCADAIGDPNPDDFDADQTVWYSFSTPATGGPYAVDISATTFTPFSSQDAIDIQLAVFESSNNSCTGILTEVESDYDPGFFDEDMDVQCLDAGKTYFIMVDGSFLDVQGYFDLTISQAPSVPIPTNDLICNAEALGAVPIGGSINNNINYANFCAETEPGEPSPFNIEQTVWFSFQAPAHVGASTSSEVSIRLESDPNNQGNGVDLQLAVYRSSNGSCTGNLQLLEEGVDNPTLSFDAEVNLTCLLPGETYWVQVDGSLIDVEGYFTIEIIDDGAGSFPANDNICNATPLGAVPNGGSINNNVSYNNYCATLEPNEPNPSAFAADETVWFSFEAPTSGNISISLESDPASLGDNPNLQLALWYSPGGTCAGPWLEMGSDYDPLLNDESMSITCLVPGATYYLQVDGQEDYFGVEEGYFTIEIEDDGGSTTFPYNNNICDAYDFGLPTGNFATLGNETNECANVELGEPGLGGYAEHTVWYQFTAPPSGRVEVEVESNDPIFGIDPEVYIFGSSTNSCTGQLSLSDGSNLPTAIITENVEATCLTPGNIYFIQVDGEGLNREGEFSIRVRDMEPLFGTGQPNDPEPVNNYCQNAISIPVQSESCTNGTGSWNSYNYGVPTASQPTSCGQNCGETWYSFTMPSSGVALVEGNDDGISSSSPIGDFSDLVVVAYTGGCGNLQQVACGSGGLSGDVGFEIAAPPGSQILLQVFNDGGDDDNENFELCVSEGCGADNCLNAIAYPIQPNVPYCFNTASATGEGVAGGAPGYFECGEGDDPEHSLYYYFVSDCNGSAVTLSIINATSSGNCIGGTVPGDGFNISFFQDSSPCDNNPDVLVDCQSFNSCMTQPINWSFTYNNLQPNTPYIVQIDGGFNFLGGSNNGTFMIQTTTSPVPMPTSTPSGCGSNNGTATATTVGGTPPFSFQWSNGAVDSIITNLSPGWYTVTVTSSGPGGCSAIDSVFVDSTNALGLQLASQRDESCLGSCDGSATVLPLSGLAINYNYLWDAAAGSQTTATATGLCAGSYSVTVSSNNGCQDSMTVQIGSPNPVQASLVNGSLPQCPGLCDGSAAITATGGSISTDYYYQWSHGDSTSLVTNLCAGNYSVTISDRNGCYDTLQLNIPVPPSPIQISLLASQDLSCAGDSSGSFSLTAAGGQAPYTYIMAGDSNQTGQFSALAAGNYLVQVIDDVGCTDTISVSIQEPTPLSAGISIDQDYNGSPISCFGAADAALSATATGGTANYSYNWSTGASSNSLNGLAAGNYSLTVSDQNGCQDSSSISLQAPDSIQLNIDTLSFYNGYTVSCASATDGQLEAIYSGGWGSLQGQWSNGSSQALQNSLAAGNYCFSVTDINGCQASSCVLLTAPDTLLLDSVQQQNIICAGQQNGELSVFMQGGLPPYSYLWSNGQRSSNISNLAAGNYQLTVTDANGCNWLGSWTITEPTPLVLQLDADSVRCNGGADGSISALLSGGIAPYSYLWSNGQSSSSINNLAAGPYQLTVTDANGCSIVASALVQEPANAVIANVLSSQNPSCNQGTDGWIDADAQGGTPNYSFLWSTGDTTEDLQQLAAGNYSLTATDARGCQATTSIQLMAPSAIQPSISVYSNYHGASISCAGASDGALTAQVQGGTAPYLISWSTGENTALIQNLSAGWYTVSFSDANGCTAVDSIELSAPLPLAAQQTVSAASCANSCDGQIVYQAVAGTGTLGQNGYEYRLLGPGQNGQLFGPNNNWSNLCAGWYVVQLRDGNGCQIQDSIEITAPAPLQLQLSQNDPSCFNGNDGSLTALATGGTAPYTYLWSDGQTTATATNLSAGSYSLSLTDANGCILVQTTSLHSPSPLAINFQVDSASCAGSSDGAILAIATGGTAPYSYLWSNGQMGRQARGLTAGNYQLTISDAQGCQFTASTTVEEPSPLQIQLQSSTPNCQGQNSGTATVVATGGTAPYTYLWSDGQTTATATNLAAGSYQLIVTDAKGCQQNASVQLSQPTGLGLAINQLQAPSCHNAADGELEAVVVGGTAPYQYNWSNGSSTANANNLAAGWYSLTVSDAGGCQLVDSFELLAPAALQLSLSSQAAGCLQGQDGEATASVQGGTLPYSFLWSNGAQTQQVTGLAAGNYQLTVTDANGCSIQGQVVVDEPASGLVGYINVQDALCQNGASGQLTAIISGGTPLANGDYNYSWSNGGNTAILSNLSAGNYSLTASDANGCTLSLSAQVGEPTGIQLTLVSSQDPRCAGELTGQAQLQASGGTSPLSYQWSDGQTAPTAQNLGAGSYSVTVTDRNGCTADLSVQITDPAPLQLNMQLNMPACAGGDDGSISYQSSSVPVNAFLWSNGQVGEPLTGLAAGIYNLTVVDQNGCSADFQYVLGGPPALGLTLKPQSNIRCAGELSASVEALASSGTAPYSYLWSNGDTQSLAQNLGAAWYAVTATDANGCQQTDSIQFVDPAPLELSAEVDSVRCLGESNGSILALAQGGSTALGGYSYSLDSLNWQASPFFPNLAAADYTIYLRDANDCVADTLVEVEAGLPFFLQQFGPNDTTLAYGDSLLLYALLNDSLGVSFSWSESLSNQLLSDSSYQLWVQPFDRAIYEFVAQNERGCRLDSSITVFIDKERIAAAPNTFTPNNDGANDRFFIQGDERLQLVKLFRVYDRWGELVFEGQNLAPNDPQAGWDGQFKGRPMNSGVYAWYAELEFIDGHILVLKGSIQLLR